MKKLIYDACSLIYLTKIKVKEKLPSLGEAIVSVAVKKELLADIERFTEAKALKENLDKKIIKEDKSKLKNIFPSKNLGKGEKETIELCTKSEGIPVTDDQKALNLALSFGLKPKTSEVILLDLLEVSIITYEEFKILLDELAVIKASKPEILSLFKDKANQIIQNKKKPKEVK